MPTGLVGLSASESMDSTHKAQPVVQTCLHFMDVYIYIYDLFGGISNIDIVGFFAVTHFVGCHAIGRVVFAVSRWVKIITLSDSRGG